MCTDFDVIYACGHKAHPARVEGPEAADIYRGCSSTAPTARCTKHCKQYAETKKVCPPSKRLVVTQIFEIVCYDEGCKPLPNTYDDDGCILMKNNIEESTVGGWKYVNGLTEKEKADMYRASAKISQPPVWGRKGPHIKKPRKVKTKQEREREKSEKERAKEVDTATPPVISTVEEPKKRGRKKKAAAEFKEAEQVATAEPTKGRKRKLGQEDNSTSQKAASVKKQKMEPKTKKAEAKKGKTEPKPQVLKNKTNIKNTKKGGGEKSQSKGKKRKLAGDKEEAAPQHKTPMGRKPKAAVVIPEGEEPEKPTAKKRKTRETTGQAKKTRTVANLDTPAVIEVIDAD
ncbi:hypothetical protein H072_4879 [Dactylellina haptotyla CBS 200.50]|uniref:Uncharacterized protein n=1 Tax=Dactylellina haptotyla (strain CBS 200.50) TaxID=1284197 RepID=S8AJA3_DACHA|nr:hypothetical protein H072_4879 [Dactylellina haptotyla CBS 200.50]